jgi:hypothetical protein
VVDAALERFKLEVETSKSLGLHSGFWLYLSGGDTCQYEVTPDNDIGEFVVRCNADESDLSIPHEQMREDDHEEIMARVLQFISDRLNLRRKERRENAQRGRTTTVYIDPETGRPIDRDTDYWRDKIW